MDGSQFSDGEELKIYLWPLLLTRIMTNTSDSHSILYWAAFLINVFLSLLLCWVLALALSDRRRFLNGAIRDMKSLYRN